VLKLLMERAVNMSPKATSSMPYSAGDAAESNTTEVAIYSLRKKLGSEFIKSIAALATDRSMKTARSRAVVFAHCAHHFVT